MNEKIAELDSCCDIFMSSNNTDDIKKAERIIQNFMNSSSIDDFCFVLSYSNNEFLIFETLKACTKSMIFKWNKCIDDSEKMELNKNLSFLFNWALQTRSKVSHYIWTAAINSVVKMIKKAYSEGMIEIYQSYTDKIVCLLNEDSYLSKRIGLELVYSLLEVFSGQCSISKQIRISKDAEIKVKQDFEKKHLADIFTRLLNLMVEIDRLAEANNEGIFELLKITVTNLETILSWNFLNKVLSMKWMILPKNEAAKRFAPPSKWNTIIQDFSIIELLFKIHNRMRFKDGTTTLSCLSLLAGLKVKFRHNSCEPIFSDNQESAIFDQTNNNHSSMIKQNSYPFSRCQYSFAFIDYLYDFYMRSSNNTNNDNNNDNSSIYLNDYEVPLLADLLYQLQEHLNSSVWLDGLMIHCIDNDIDLDSNKNFPRQVAEEYAQHVVIKLSKFIELYTAFGIKCIEGAAMENLSKSDTIHIETCDRVLSRFVAFSHFQEYLQYTEKIPSPSNSLSNSQQDFISSCNWEKMVFENLVTISLSCHRRLFLSFLKAHLAAPDGFRNVSTDCDVIIIESDDDDDLDLEIVEDDKKTYEGCLYATGFSGLECISESLEYLSSVLHQRLKQLQDAISLVNPEMTSYPNSISFSLLEDLHWLISIAGYTILNVTDDVLISNRIMHSRHMDSSDQRAIYNHSKDQLKSMLERMNNSNETGVQQIINEYQKLLMNCTQEINMNLNSFNYAFQIDLNQCDDLLRLLYITLRGFVLVVHHCTSGQVVSDFVWLFNRWVLGYLQINDDADSVEWYEVPVVAVFREAQVNTVQSPFSGLQCRSEIINIILKLITICIECWNHDQVVMENVVILLQNMTYSPYISKLLLQSDLWMNKIIREIVRLDEPYSKIRRDFLSNFITSVMSVATACESAEQLNQYLQVMDPIAQRFSCLLSPNNCINGGHNISADYETEFLRCLSILHGLVMTRWPSRISRLNQQRPWSMGYTRLFNTLYPWLELCVQSICSVDKEQKKETLLLFKPAIVQAMLECMLEIAKTILLELDRDQTSRFYALNLHMFRSYVSKFKCESKIFNFNNENQMNLFNTNQEDTTNEIRLIFSIASDLLSRQVFDEFDLDCGGECGAIISTSSSTTTTTTQTTGNREIASLMGYEVIAKLILYIAPYITMEMLEIPDLGNVFFQCLTLVAEFSPSSFLIRMDQDFNISLIQLFLRNITNSNNQIVSYCLRGISSLADFYYNRDSRTQMFDQILTPDSTIQSTSNVQEIDPNKICTHDLTETFRICLISIFSWIRNHQLASDIIDNVSNVFIIIYKHNEELFYEEMNKWLANINSEFVTRKADELIYAIDNSGIEKRLKIASQMENNIEYNAHWLRTTVVATNQNEGPTSSNSNNRLNNGNNPISVIGALFNSSYRCNFSRWNDLILLINSYLDIVSE